MVEQKVVTEIIEILDIEEEKDGSESYIKARYNGGGKGLIHLQMEYGFLKVN